MGALDDIAEAFGRLHDRIAFLEQRFERSNRPGVVTDVDPEKQRVRIRVGGTDEAPQKSPWVPYAQVAGARKIHSPPSVGQQMVMLSKDGDFEQGVALPYTWSNQNASPSTKGDEHVDTLGATTDKITASAREVTVGGATIKIVDGAIHLTADRIIFEGEVFLGGPDASRPLALLGSVDSDGDIAIGNLSTRVKAL